MDPLLRSCATCMVEVCNLRRLIAFACGFDDYTHILYATRNYPLAHECSPMELQSMQVWLGFISLYSKEPRRSSYLKSASLARTRVREFLAAYSEHAKLCARLVSEEVLFLLRECYTFDNLRNPLWLSSEIKRRASHC